MIRRFGFRGATTLIVASLLATACDGEPSGPSLAPIDGVTVDEPRFSTRLVCEGDREALSVTCEVRAPAGTQAGGASADLIVGNQGTYMELASTDVAYDSVAWQFSFDVTVENLLPQPIGTKDGTTLDSAGVRVFFHSGPDVTSGTGTITVIPDSVGTFTSTDQPYYQYDEIIPSGGTSGAKTWTLDMPSTVATFAFTVYVAAEVPSPEGFVQLDTDSLFVEPDSTYQLNPLVKSAVGATIGGTVSFASSDSAVAVVDSTGLVTGVSSGFATITAFSGESGEITGSAVIGVCPKLQVGETMTFEMPEAAELCLSDGNGAQAEYVYSPVNTDSSSSLSLTLTGTGIAAIAGPPNPQLNPAGATPSFNLTMDDLIASIAAPRREIPATGSLLQPRASLGTSLIPGGPSRLIVLGVPTVGDIWSLNVAQGCNATLDVRTGRVAVVSSNFIIVTDTLNPPGGFTTAQYDSIALELDTLAWETVTENFGEPADLDGNDRIVVFFTRAINELAPPGSSSVTYADFEVRDLFSSAPESCPLSNEGEMLYSLVPDPTGVVNSNVRTVSLVRENVVRELAQQLQSLINASRRIYVNGDTELEESWLDQGLSDIAAELIFYRTSVGLTPGSNIVLSTLTTGPTASRRVAAFNTYANGNFGRFRSWLQRPDTSGAFRTDVTLASRGVLWAFLRYAADRVGTENQQLFWQSLIDQNLEGKANLAQAINADPDEWLRDFIVALYADDAVSGVAPEYTTKSWDYRSLYGGLNGSYQLVPRPLTNATPLTLSYSRGGGAVFARFAVPSGGYARITALSGGEVPTTPLEIAITRTK